MTVIFGVNLSDRVYLAGDSRISDLLVDKDGQEHAVPKSDNILKVDLVKGNSGVALACAGDAKFAAYILNALYREAFSKNGVMSIRDNVEEWAKLKAHEYFTRNKYTSATFIFAGSDRSRQKEISASRVLTLAKSYLSDGRQGSMKSHLAKALENHADKHDGKVGLEKMVLPVADTVLFSMKIGKSGVEIEDTVFGQFLLYGPRGLIKEDIEERHIGQLEYATSNGDITQDIILIMAMLHELAENKQLVSVGGCIIPIGAFHDGNAYFIDGELRRMDKNSGKVEVINAYFRRGSDFYRVDENGAWRKMIRVADYRGADDQLHIL